MASHRTPRGSVWRQWDLHLHTPASFHWKGSRLRGIVGTTRDAELDKIITAINAAEPSVSAVMDYWTFDGYLAIKKRSAQSGGVALLKTVFPGIELRLVSPTKYRLNAHAVFTDDLTEQQLRDFKSKLHVAIIDRPLSDECLIEFARSLPADKLQKHGFKKADVDSDSDIAYLAGAQTAEITTESFKEAFEVIPPNKGVILMPWDTNDGLKEADWFEHYAYVQGLLHASTIFETRDWDFRCAFVGERTVKNAPYFEAFQSAINDVPRLVVSGTDAHSSADYGKFPSGKTTWIKAEPTFLGLLQAIKEPSKRSYIGAKPPKLAHVEGNKTAFIDRITVSKKPGTLAHEDWFSGLDIALNHDLVAVIGNKGSGKSALADILALLGDTKNAEHFSFLTTERFRKAPINRAQHFDGQLTWASGTSQTHNLGSNPSLESVERVRYIPQEFFEELCNEHVRGDSTRFERELRAVIFSHIRPQDRLGKTSFNDLLDLKERELLGSLSSFRGDLSKLNTRIESVENKLLPEVRHTLQSKLALKNQELAEHDRQKPSPVVQPSGAPQDTVTLSRLTAIDLTLRELNQDRSVLETNQKHYTEQQAAVSRVRDRLTQINRQIKSASIDLAGDLEIIGLKFSELVEVTTHDAKLKDREEELRLFLATVSRELDPKNSASVAGRSKALADEQKSLRDVLDAPTRLHQQYLADLAAWESKRTATVGTANTPDTVEALKAELTALDSIPSNLEALKAERDSLSANIFGVLETQRTVREELFAPVQELINNSFELREDYKLQFQNALAEKGLEQYFFDIIKQNTGTFRGDDEGKIAFRNIVSKHDVNAKLGAKALVAEIMDATSRDLRSQGCPPVPIAKLLRSGKSAKDLYDTLYGFTFLEPRYSLLFQDTHIAQLSPGQRGALLLIFYLLVDTDQSPIVLDQPEENLDNETVVGLLVPVVTKAKQKRQIIMVTHNPNLAVVCDAEQIIHAHFDRNTRSKITYTTGPIEDPEINKLVVDVLEGTKKAFNNRANKYHS